jgi:hypothetical protein
VDGRTCILRYYTSYSYGLGLIHRHRPDLLDYWSLDKENKLENTILAFDIAEQHLGIPKLFEAQDVVDVKKVRVYLPGLYLAG